MVDAVTLSPDYCFRLKDAFLGLQNLLIAFGALVLMPVLIGLDPNVALFTAGLGTLLFQACTGGQIPTFLGSSFAFVAPAVYGVSMWGLAETLCGLAFSGVAYFLLAGLIRWRGVRVVHRLFPPLVTGPVIIGIGLILAPVAVNMATGLTGDGAVAVFERSDALLLSGVSLSVAVITRLFARGWFQLLPIVTGVSAGCLLAAWMGLWHTQAVAEAAWFQVPAFVTPVWHVPAMVLMFPVALVSAVEHIGDVVALAGLTKRPYLEQPGLHRSLMGDGLASAVAGCLGGPPSITYAEVTAGLALTRAFNPAIMTWSALFAIGLSFVGKMGALLQSIPTPVMGGLMMLLFGMIAVVGIHIVSQCADQLLQPRAMTIVGLMLVIPVGGMVVSAGGITLAGIGLGGVVGILLHVVLPEPPPPPQP